MKYLVPAFIIGAVGGLLDGFSGMNTIWCFLIGVIVFYLYVFVKSVVTTCKIMKQTKGAKKICIDKNNNLSKADNE